MEVRELKHDLRKWRLVLQIKRLALQTWPRLHDWIFLHAADDSGFSGGGASEGWLFARHFLAGNQKCHPASTLPVCCSSDASRHSACAGDVMRWPDTVGDSGAAVCDSSGCGVSVCPSISATLAKMTSSLNPPCCHLFVAVPTPAGSRGVRLTLCDGPTLSETSGGCINVDVDIRYSRVTWQCVRGIHTCLRGTSRDGAVTLPW